MVMKKGILIVVLIVIGLWILVSVKVIELVYELINLLFGGNLFNGLFLLSKVNL